MRPIYVESENLAPNQITYTRTEDEAVLAIGAYRLPSSSNDLSKLKEAAELFRKIREEGERAHRDVLARIAFLEQQEKHRAMASSITPTAPAMTAPAGPDMFRRPCLCGTNDPRLVHRADGPCHPATREGQPCPTCNGNGCQDCVHFGLAALHTSQPAPAQIYEFPKAPPAPAPAPAPAN